MTYLQKKQQRELHEQQARRAQQVQMVARLESLSDGELIASANGFPAPHEPMEMDRRLKEAVVTLTAELIAFRKSSDAAAGKLSNLTKVLLAATVVLVILTGAVTWLTAVLASRG